MDSKQIPRSIFGLLGQRLDYSFSKAYFTEKFEKQGLEDHEYRNFEIEQEEDLLRFRESVTYNPTTQTTNGKSEILRGLNVTIPYKESMLKICDHLTPEAEAIGAVNTIVIEDNVWTGHNTDVYGFAKSLEPFLPIAQNALILGTGGASKAIAYTLEALKVPFLFVSRTPQGEYCIPYEQIDSEVIKIITLIINSTPVGTFPDVEEKPALPYEHLTKSHILYDLVYNPSNTMFMKMGKVKGARVTNGYQMLVHQAEKSWELWNE
ncbi:MAG: shikimate dehydrogenase family protein [Nonlabens sp.]|uniref:shikimate dehydrogenase family protein n=1 Tax=Nonlabens sp. TaxID=1888209 RepID=UPI003EF11EC7